MPVPTHSSYNDHSDLGSEFNSDIDMDIDEIEGTNVPNVCHKQWLLDELSNIVQSGTMTIEQTNYLVTWEGNGNHNSFLHGIILAQ